MGDGEKPRNQAYLVAEIQRLNKKLTKYQGYLGEMRKQVAEKLDTCPVCDEQQPEHKHWCFLLEG